MRWSNRIIEALQRVIKFGLIATAGAGLLIFLAWSALLIRRDMLIHEPRFQCYGLAVFFEGPKSKRYLEGMSRFLSRSGAEYKIEGDQIFTTTEFVELGQPLAPIRNDVWPEWFSEKPWFETSEQQRIVEGWQKNKKGNLNAHYCHLIEAAISKNGIDIEARRGNPNIWPRDKFPIPNE